MYPARTPCICIDTSELFSRLSHAGPELLWIFTIFCASFAAGLVLCGVFVGLLQSWLDFIRGEKPKRKNDER